MRVKRRCGASRRMRLNSGDKSREAAVKVQWDFRQHVEKGGIGVVRWGVKHKIHNIEE